MKFQVLNRIAAKNYTYKQHNHKYVIISINDVHDTANKFNRSPELVDVLTLYFDDVEQGDAYCIEKEDAEKIIKFMNKHMDVDECIVHCTAGVSRSAGVCAALMLIINGSDDEIFNNYRFCPNRTCYRKVLDAYFGSYSEEAIDEKFRKNIEAWRKHQDY